MYFTQDIMVLSWDFRKKRILKSIFVPVQEQQLQITLNLK